MNGMETADTIRDPILLVSAKGRVLSANTAFHQWLQNVAPRSTATDFSALLSGARGLRSLSRRLPRLGRGRAIPIRLRSVFDGAQLSCEGTVDRSPFDRTYLIRITAARAGGWERASSEPGRRRSASPGSVQGWTHRLEQGALQAIAEAARSLAAGPIDDSQLAQVDSIRRNVDVLMQGIRRPGAARWGVESGGFAMEEMRDLRVLLVEDNPINRTVASHMLARLGLAPDICTNGQEAVERATAQAYDLILMDVQMPEMDGIEATYRIRELRPDRRPTRIVALTANTVDETRLACERAGMDGFLAKPFTLAELSATLKLLLNRPGERLRS